MTPRKRNNNDRGYPPWWEVHYQWEWTSPEGEKRVLESRQWEYQIHGSNEWFVFDRYVINHGQAGIHANTPHRWVDGLSQPPYGAFVSHYPARIRDARPIQERNGVKRGRRTKRTEPEPDDTTVAKPAE